MNERSRFLVICGVVALCLVGMVWFLFGSGGSSPEGVGGEDDGAMIAGTDLVDDGGNAGPALISSGTAMRSGTATANPRAVRAERQQGRGLITGWVDYADGRMASGIAVEAWQMPYKGVAVLGAKPRALTTHTNAEGYFVFDGLADGRYWLRATDGTVTGTTNVLMRDGARMKADILLEHRGVLAGRVTDESGAAIAGALVAPAAAGDDAKQNRPPLDEALTTFTEEDGHFRIEGLPGRPHVLLAQAEGYAAAISEPASPDSEDIEIVLGVGGVLSGRTVDATTNEPVAGVQVVVFPTDIQGPGNEIKSDETGAFRFASLRPASYLITVEDSAYVMTEPVADVPVETGGEAVVTIRVGAGGMVTGRVMNASKGEPAEGIRVWMYRQRVQSGEKRLFEAPQLTAKNGTYVIGGLPPGTYDVNGQEGHGLVRSRTVQVSLLAGQVLDGVDFPMTEGCTIRGRVLSADGAAVESAIVTVTNRYNQNTRALSDSEGEFVVTGVAPFDQTYLAAESQVAKSAVFGPVTFGPTGVATVELRLSRAETGSIGGTVVDARGRGTSAQLTASADTPEGRISGGAVADESGRFVMKRLVPGTYTIQGYNNATFANGAAVEPVTVAGGQEVRGIEIRLDQATEGDSTISGHVVDEDGEGVAGATVTGGNARTVSGARGAFELTGLPDGLVRLSAGHRESGAGTFAAQAGATDVVITLAKQHVISGRVIDGTTKSPIPRFEVVIDEIGEAQYMLAAIFQNMLMFENPEGRFTIPWPTRPGTQPHVFARAAGYALGSAQTNGEEEVTITLIPGRKVSGRVENEDGDPVYGAYLYEGPAPMGLLKGIGCVAMTDAEGAFVIDTIGPETTTIGAAYPGLSDGSAPLPPGPSTNNLVITLVSGTCLEVRVALNGWNATRTTVGFQPKGERIAAASTRVGEDGIARIEGMAGGPGTVRVNAQTPGGLGGNWSIQIPVTVQEGRTTALQAEMPPLDAALEGTVTSNGSAMAGAALRVIYSDAGGSSGFFETVADSNGVYHFAALPAGQAQFRIDTTAHREEIVLYPGQAVAHDIDVPSSDVNAPGRGNAAPF